MREVKLHEAWRAKQGDLKEGGPELCFLALAIFRSHFSDDEDEELVRAKWNEWEEDRAKAIRAARYVMDALGGPGITKAAQRITPESPHQ